MIEVLNTSSMNSANISSVSEGGLSGDAKEFALFMRYFSTRLVQSVVQSRMGKLTPHPCHPSPEHSDWFNIVIDEIGEIAAYLKNNVSRSYPPLSTSLTLDFILYTADGDSLNLESWVVRLDKDDSDSTINVHTTFYHQLSTLLKSVIAVSRVAPVYRHYVKNQGSETFVIFYRVYEGCPDLCLLGEEQKFRRIGYLPSPYGTLYVELHYRTKMEISPPPYIDKRSKQPVPLLGSEPVAVSPMSTTNLNLNIFSTSPQSQDITFDTEHKPSFKLGRSVSSTEESDRIMHPSGSSKSGQNSPAPTTPSSFPQRSSIRLIRARNNSFPFSTLFFESQISLDQSKLLPKVPEDAIITVGLMHPSTSDRILNMQKPEPSLLAKRNSIAFEAGMASISSRRLESGDQLSNQTGLQCVESDKRVVFERTGSNRCSPVITKKDDEDEGNSSDDSFVKVVPFTSTEDLGSDLTEFFREFRLAPKNLTSFSSEDTEILNKQLDEFKRKETKFNDFIAGLKDPDDYREF